MKLRCARRCCRSVFVEGQDIVVLDGKNYHGACAASERRERRDQNLPTKLPLVVLFVCPWLLVWPPRP